MSLPGGSLSWKQAVEELRPVTTEPYSPGGSPVPPPSVESAVATAAFDSEQGFNLERLGHPNVEPTLCFAAHSIFPRHEANTFAWAIWYREAVEIE